MAGKELLLSGPSSECSGGSESRDNCAELFAVECARCLTRDEFVRKYAEPNLPCLIRGLFDGSNSRTCGVCTSNVDSGIGSRPEWRICHEWLRQREHEGQTTGTADAVDLPSVDWDRMLADIGPSTLVPVATIVTDGSVDESPLHQFRRQYKLESTSARPQHHPTDQADRTCFSHLQSLPHSAVPSAGAAVGGRGSSVTTICEDWTFAEFVEFVRMREEIDGFNGVPEAADENLPVVLGGSLNLDVDTPSAIQRFTSSIGNAYLKDWHLPKIWESLGRDPFYVAPEWFDDDWLNNSNYLATSGADDYRFVYLGPPGTFTPLHIDVVRSFSWSVNICGTKHWLFFPPAAHEMLRGHDGELPFDISVVNTGLVGNPANWPRLSEALSLAIQVTQRPGDAIFVPSGWLHQVRNVGTTACLSINHNWINSAGLSLSFAWLLTEAEAVRRELADCRELAGDDFINLCERILRANAGLAAIDFLKLIQINILSLPPSTLELIKARLAPWWNGIGRRWFLAWLPSSAERDTAIAAVDKSLAS